MQPLNEDAKQRLLRFKAFMEQAAKAKHEDTKKELASVAESIEALTDQTAAEQHANTIGEVKQRDEAAATDTESYLAAVDSRLVYFCKLISGIKAGEGLALPNSPSEAFTQIIDALEKEAEGFEKAIDPAERDRLKSEKAELLARKCFADNRAKILSHQKGGRDPPERT